MLFLSSRRGMLVCICLALALGISASNAQEATKVSGTISATYTHQDTIVVGDEPGHFLFLTASAGTNAGATEEAILAGAEVLNMAHSDLVMGNGKQWGYVRFAQGADTTFASWQGSVTTKPAEDGAPVTTMEGTFTYTKGTGQFLNIKGSGIYKGEFTSEKGYAAEWQGEYALGILFRKGVLIEQQ